MNTELERMRTKIGTIRGGLAAAAFVAATTVSTSAASATQTIVFVDGSRLDVSQLEVKGNVVVWTTSEGKLRSVPRSYVHLEATFGARPDRTVEVLELLGFRRISDRIASSAREAAEAFGRVSRPSDLVARVLVDAFARGFEPERFYEVASRTFRVRVTDADLEPSTAWLRTPLAQRMDRLETTAPRPTGEPFDSFLVSLDEQPPSRGRLKLVEGIDRASRTTDAAVEMQAAMLRALIEGVNRTREPERRLSASEVERAIDSTKKGLSGRAHARVRLALLYTYRDASDEDLAAYLSYLESASGRWLCDVVFESLVAAMKDAAERSGDAIAESLLDLKKTKA